MNRRSFLGLLGSSAAVGAIAQHLPALGAIPGMRHGTWNPDNGATETLTDCTSGTYTFEDTVPTDYFYFMIPVASLAGRHPWFDIGPFEFAMEEPRQIEVGGEPCLVYRSYHPVGGSGPADVGLRLMDHPRPKHFPC